MNVKRKILFVNSSVSGGGAGKALIYLLRALQKDQVDSVVVLPADGVVGESIRQNGTPIRYIPWLPERFGKTQFKIPSYLSFKWVQSFLNILLLPYFGWKVAKIAREENVDLICSNHQFNVPVSIAAGYFSGKKVAIYCREYPEGFKARYFFRNVAHLDVVEKVFTISNVSGELYSGMEKLELLYDSYDFNDFGSHMPEPTFRKQYNIPSDKFVFGFMGRIIERKGVDFLIRAFAKMHKEHSNTHLAIVGGNDPGITYDLISQYKQLAKDLGVENHVTFTGFQKDVRAMSTDFDVCVMPSLNPEPFGLVYLESVICKIPCLVPDNSGASEAVIKSKNGVLFKAKDVDSLAQTMSHVYVDRENVKLNVKETFNNVKHLFDTYEQSGNITKAFVNAAGGGAL